MAKITLINDDSRNRSGAFDLIFTDPPFDMSGQDLLEIINSFDCDHFFCITNIHLVAEIAKHFSGWDIKWDVVFNMIGPKKKANHIQPNFTHFNGIYLTKKRAKTIFDRRAGQRTDVFAPHYYPTILDSPRLKSESSHSQSKNPESLANVLRGFKIRNFVDPFAGSGSAGLAAIELGLSCTLIEKNKVHYQEMKAQICFFGVSVEEVA